VAIALPSWFHQAILSGPRPDDKRLVDVEWQGKKLLMFYEDIQKRGEKIKGEPA
jgi:hypothetical protein